ncbi:MAG: septum formation initiator family protein [Muribaculaceae bacterium]|nr:septum formation initiator family protein [Muribaculaceae bacterium]
MGLNFKLTRPQWIPKWVNLPFLVFLAFIFMLLFYGDNNYMMITKQKNEINKLNAQIKEKEDSAQYYERKFRELDTDKETLEKLAREQYRMKRANEDVYVTDIR